MKKVTLLFVMMAILLPFCSALCQDLNDYIDRIKGDTLVIKDYFDLDEKAGSLYEVMHLDTANVPEGRVYQLKTNGYYPLLFNASTIRNTVIVGEDNRMIVNNDDTSAPPLISGYEYSCGGIDVAHDLTIKNCQIVNVSNECTHGIYFTSTKASGLNLLYDNCLFEHAAHWFVFVRDDSNQSVAFRNCYFVNMNGQPCRRDGGVFISFHKQEKLLVENCTHIMAQGNLYKFMTYEDTYEFDSIIFNHNTFINCAGNLLLNPGYQSNMYITNNIFVNCNVQPYMKGLDYAETDPDSLPMGIVNVRDIPDSQEQPVRKIKVEKNVIYWDPGLSDIVSQVSSADVNGTSEWYDQMITMNTRTQAMFDDDASYPYLVEADWYNTKPDFTDPKNLFSDQLNNLKDFSIATVELTSLAILPDWRLVNTEPDTYVYPDWPVPVDLSYSDADLLTAAISNFPVGDLNWFPDKKSEWLAQRDAEYEYIQTFPSTGPQGIETGKNVISTFRLDQNYPNPFNASTIISFSIPKAAYVNLKIYNMQGQEVATLLDGFSPARNYKLSFDGQYLSSGTYIAQLAAGDFNKSIKLVLIK
jgi:hypothetical protein